MSKVESLEGNTNILFTTDEDCGKSQGFEECKYSYCVDWSPGGPVHIDYRFVWVQDKQYLLEVLEYLEKHPPFRIRRPSGNPCDKAYNFKPVESGNKCISKKPKTTKSNEINKILIDLVQEIKNEKVNKENV